jgi:NAD(P) transhydrogenase subunit alpha
MQVLVPAETRAGERRVAMVPDVVGKLTALGIEVTIESGAGRHAYAADEAYSAAGATVAPSSEIDRVLGETAVVASVRPLDPDRVRRMRRGSLALSFLQPVADVEVLRAARDAGVTLLSFDLVPRISRAQSMDALSSQALVTGYRAALVAADRLPSFFPLFMTAAGTVQAARVLVLGAGVAGLQAIATAKRLGAVVSAYDVRAASADEVKSMGATFVHLDLDQLEGAGGYAREMSQDRAVRQQELLTPYVAGSDVVITTAAIPGRQAPLLVTRAMVETMRPGSVVVDLAAESGGNVEGSRPGEETLVGQVTVWGGRDVASELPVHASRLYSMNVVNVLALVVKDGELNDDTEDEIVDGAAVVLAGEPHHPAAYTALGIEPPPPPAEPGPAAGVEGGA